MVYVNNIYFFSLLFLTSHSLAELPADIIKCQAEDVICITNTINDILKKNPNGRNDIGLPKIDPYAVSKIIISDSKGSSSLNLDLTFLNVEIYGLTAARVQKSIGFAKDPSNSKFEIYGFMPKLEIRSKYKADGRILILPIQGDGSSKIVADNVKISIKFKPNVINKDGKIHFTDSKVKVLLEPERLQIHLENLFNGNKELGDNMNTFLNENWKDVWTELAPNVNAAMADIIKDILSDVFQKLSYDDFYA